MKIIEIDITHRCNLACRHCNRLCNSYQKYGIERSMLDMDMRHISFLIAEIKSQPKGTYDLLRIIGGEPLLSPILIDTVKCFEKLIEEGYAKHISIVTNGTLPIPKYIKSYIVFAPMIIGEMVNRVQRPLTPAEVYAIKNIKHRNITICPSDFGYSAQICDRIDVCGIHYSVFGFSYTAACFPSMMMFDFNHKRFLRHLPATTDLFFDDSFSKEVCNFCVFAIDNYADLVASDATLNNDQYIGSTWQSQIRRNKCSFVSPNVDWIETYETK